jgi:catechol 2,3-dioxygenase-like lactoylglutathione lyase family enzyme
MSVWLIEGEELRVAVPEGGEAEARRFYGEILGLGGTAGQGVQLAFDIEVPFRPVEELAALVVADLEGLLGRLAEHGVRPDGGEQLVFFERVYVRDPFGNRLALLAER